MTNEECLKKAIKKAIKNGWRFPFGVEKSQLEFIYTSPQLFIFSHDFAKAIWGKEIMRLGIEMGTAKGEIIELENWQYHLQQMVLQKEPLKYIEKFL